MVQSAPSGWPQEGSFRQSVEIFTERALCEKSMRKKRSRQRLLFLAAVATVLVSGTAAWLSRDDVRFWWLFESLGQNSQGYPEYRHRETGIVMVRLLGGRFFMGARDGEGKFEDGSEVELPRHEVSVGPFLIGTHELSRETWTSFMGASDVSEETVTGSAVEVSWDDCQRFCEQTGLSVPTEAEWEYACRGGTEDAYAFGGLSRWDKSAGGQAVMLDATESNAYGLFNMHGNAMEWCEDFFDPDFYSKPESRTPNPVCTTEILAEFSDGPERARVVRGGFWANVDRRSRSAARASSPLNSENGFRVVFRLW